MIFPSSNAMNEAINGHFKRLVFLAVFAFLPIVFSNGVHPQSGYLVLAPAIFRSGVKQSITIRIFEESDPVLVKADIVDWREQSIITTRTTRVQGDGKIVLTVPTGFEGKAELQICGNCHGHAAFRFRNSTTITIVNKGTSAFVQTDKPIYKPSQKVHVNVYTVDRDLRPAAENVTIYATAPNDVKIVEWRDVKPGCGGTVEVSFPLSDQPPEGKWKVYAELQGNTYNTTFDVAKYVLPKFDVTIIPPPAFRNWSTCEKATVIGKYSFGKPVKGKLIVNVTVRGEGYFARDLDQSTPKTWSMDFNGEAQFSLCLQQDLIGNLDQWPIGLQRYFQGSLQIWATVISEDGSKFSSYDDTTTVSKNFVDFEFSSDTRKYFKHGIPFNGEIYVSYVNGTPAENVMIEIMSEIRHENSATQNLVSSSDGIIRFTMPATSPHTNIMWLKASIISIDGIPTNRRQYLSKYFGLHSWHSPSECYLSIEKPSSKLSANHPVELIVKSTCDCDFTLYYEVLSRGDIVLSNSQIVNSSNSDVIGARTKRSPRTRNLNNRAHSGDQVCQTTVLLTPTSQMTPLAKMLVYYVRPNGEGVADNIHLSIEPELENKVQLHVTKTVVKPGEEVPVSVRTSGDSCVCMGATDKSLHFISPDYLLSENKIFEEMYSYDMDNLPFEEQTHRHPRLYRSKRGRRRSRRSTYENQLKIRDSFHAFLETGLVVMTDSVSLKHKQNVQVIFSEVRRQSLTASSTPKIRRKPRRLRSFFPETWYWKCFETDASGEKDVVLRAPDTITSWVINAVGTNFESGIGVSENIELRTKKNFFIDLNMPYSAIRGEELYLPVTIHSYLESCSLVRLAINAAKGVSFPRARSANARRIVKYLCVDGDDTVTTKVKMLFSELGNSTILAVADAAGGPNICCGANNKISTNLKEVNASYEILRGNIIGVDSLLKKIKVEPEGEPREYTHSVFFCPNEKMNITTVPSTFHFLTFSSKKNSLSFLTKASSNIHIVLSASEEKTSSSYEIILGGGDNTRSWIERDEQILVTSATRNILSESEARSFWIHWTDHGIKVGYGVEEVAAAVILTLTLTEPPQVKYIGLGTSGHTPAEFRILSTEGFGDGFSEVFQLDVPKYAIPGSIMGRASIIGDVMGPTLKNLNNLLKLPYGCGEQNMINFAPNIHILKYLKTTNQLSSETRNTAQQYLIRGYQRQLTYRRQNGSYSAFGDVDDVGSMWLTAFVMKSYAQAKEFIYVDQKEIDRPLKWIISHQLEDGSFPAHGKIMNKDVQAGINKKIALTAYVVIAILETKSGDQESIIAVEKAVEYLQDVNVFELDPYTAAMLAYALALTDGDIIAEQARRALLDMSIVQGHGSYRFWSLNGHIGDRFFAPDDVLEFLPSSSKQTIAAAEIELASYALLAFTKSGDVSAALPIVRWISRQRNAQGGFSSTQDTCAALQALSSYASFAFVGGVNINITLEGPDNYLWNVQLNSRNSEILQNGDVPALTTTATPVFVKANGDGCALLQIHVQYNIPKSDEETDFFIELLIKNSQGPAEDKTNSGHPFTPDVVDPSIAKRSEKNNQNSKEIFNVRVCGRWLKRGSSNMAVLEFPLLTGFIADEESLSQALSNKTKSFKKYEIENSVIYFYFDEISSHCKTCISFKIQREYEVDELSHRYLKLYDYYEPAYASSIAYDADGPKCMEEGGCTAGEFEDDYPVCKCYRECGYEGERVCGDDGEFYENTCRMEMKSCEVERQILARHDEECEIEETEETTVEPPIMPPLDEYLPEYEEFENLGDADSFTDFFYRSDIETESEQHEYSFGHV